MERGNFIWKGEEIVWEPSKNGRFRLDNFFGVCPYDAPIIIASNSLKRAVGEKLKEEIKKLFNNEK